MFERLELSGEADLYQTDYTKPVGVQGYKAGPNNQFFETMRRVRDVGRYVFYMEPDCVPIRSDWLGQLMDRLEGEMPGSSAASTEDVERSAGVSCATSTATPSMPSAILQFQEFLSDLESALSRGFSRSIPGMPTTWCWNSSSPARAQMPRPARKSTPSGAFSSGSRTAFRATDFIQNVSARLDVQEPDPALLDNVRAESPGTYVIHNSPLARELTA